MKRERISAFVQPYVAGCIRAMAQDCGVSRSRVIEAMLDVASWEAAVERLAEEHEGTAS